MSLLLDCLALRAHQHPQAIVLDDGKRELTAGELLSVVAALREKIVNMQCRSVGIVGDNTIGWIITDLALMGLPVRVVPIPAFFTSAQREHAVREASIDTLLGPAETLHAIPWEGRLADEPLDARFDICAAQYSTVDARNTAHTEYKQNVYEKVTFTSGSTGNAKGVRLSLAMLEATANAIATALAPLQLRSHLGVLPYATLLENVAGIYAPLLKGVTVHVRRMAQLGLASPEQFNPFLLLGEIQKINPQATILVPQLLLALVSLGERGLEAGNGFRFIAVGGGKVSVSLIEKAHALGLPVYEGYGLSECGSVVTLNLPGNYRHGSTGKPLAHSHIRIGADSEILVEGAVMSGYLNEPDHGTAHTIATGDLGYFDEDGFLHVNGRKKNMFITAFGRNVNPEWIEAELLRHLPIRQAAVFGEALPRNVAILVPRAGFNQADIEAAVAACNQTLPDYARIGRIVVSPISFTTDNGMATANGRLRRTAIEAHFASELNTAQFSLEEHHGIF